MVKIAEKQISTSSLKTSPFWKSVVSAFKWIALIILIGILLQRIRKLPDVATLTSTTATTEMTMVNAGTANSPAATFPVAAATATFTSSTTQGTTSHGRDASYSSIDISSHGIPPVVPTRTGDSSTTMHPPPSPLTSSSSPPAPVPNKTATKGFNLGLLNMTYPQYLQHKPSNGTKEDWDEWYNSTLSRNRPNRIIIKLFAIHKDEWPLRIASYARLVGAMTLGSYDSRSNLIPGVLERPWPISEP